MRLFLLLCVVVAGPAFAQSALSLTGEASAFSAKLIDHQIIELEASKVSMAGPVTSLVLGGSSLIVGLVIVATSTTSFVVVGLSIALGALLPVAAGIVWLVANIVANNRIDTAVRVLRDQRASPALLPVVTF